jgi:hypothetical protein
MNFNIKNKYFAVSFLLGSTLMTGCNDPASNGSTVEFNKTNNASSIVGHVIESPSAIDNQASLIYDQGSQSWVARKVETSDVNGLNGQLNTINNTAATNESATTLALATKANTADTTAALSLKADQTTLAAGLAGKLDKAGGTISGDLQFAQKTTTTETTAAAAYTTADKAKTWFNSILNALKYFDGTTVKTVATTTDVTTAQNTLNSSIALKANTSSLGTIASLNSISDSNITGVAGSKVSGDISGNAAGFNGSLGGDVVGNQGATVVTKLQGYAVSSLAPVSKSVMKFISGVWTSAFVDFSELTGSIVDSQITSVSGSKVTGALSASVTIPGSQVVGDILGKASSLTGTIPNTQVTGLGTLATKNNITTSFITDIASYLTTTTAASTYETQSAHNADIALKVNYSDIPTCPAGKGLSFNSTTKVFTCVGTRIAPTISVAAGTSHTGGFSADGSGTYTTPANVLYLKVKIVGGGGGSSAGSGYGSGGNGGNSVFGTNLIVANGGLGGGVGSSPNSGGLPGTVNSPATSIFNISGGDGSPSNSISQGIGGSGGNSFLGGGGAGGNGCGYTNANGKPNTGGGAGGGGCNNGTMGSGGGAGNYIEALISSPAASYTYSVALGGNAATNGAVGGSGYLVVEEYY